MSRFPGRHGYYRITTKHDLSLGPRDDEGRFMLILIFSSGAIQHAFFVPNRAINISAEDIAPALENI